VALISFDFAEYCIRLAGALSQHAEILLILPDSLAGPHLEKLDSAVTLHLFRHPRLRQPIDQIRTLRTIFRRVEEFKADLIHYQGGHMWFSLSLSFWRKYPLVFTVHDFRPHPGDRENQKCPFFIEKLARCNAREFIVHTEQIREMLVRQSHFPSQAISVIPHIQTGIGLSARSAELEEEHLVLFLGRIWEYKGLEYLIRAEPLISARVPDVRILVAGRGEDFSRYSRMMTHPDRFIVDNAHIPEERVADYFRRASVVVLPYVEASQSGVIPMAYSAGKPVVATKVGGLPQLVEDGRTGFLVEPRNATALAEAIVHLLLDPKLRHQMGANGKRKIEAECSPCRVAEKTFEVYRRIGVRADGNHELVSKEREISSRDVARTKPFTAWK